MSTTHSSIPRLDQSAVHQLSHARSIHTFRHEPSNASNLLPTWTPLPIWGKTSKRGLDSEEEEDADVLEVDELAFDDDVQTPVKKRGISSYTSTLSRSRSRKISPRRATKVDTKVLKLQSGQSAELQPPDNEAVSTAGPSRTHRTPSSSDNFEPSLGSGPATESNTFTKSNEVGAEHDYTRNTSFITQSERLLLGAQPVALGGPSVRNSFSRPTILPNPSLPTLEPNISSAPSYIVREYPKRRRRQAQPQWEPLKASRSRVDILPTREADALELEVLTNANVSPVVFLRPRYAVLPRDKEREAAMRWNLRWLSKTFENLIKMRKEEISKPLLDNDGPKPVAVPEMTRSQRRDLIIDGIYEEEEAGSISSE